MNQRWFDWDIFWCWFVAWIIVMICTFLIASMATDMSGRQVQDHVEPLPANVAMLNPHSYLIAPGARVSPSLICRGDGNSTGDTSVKTISDVGKADWPTYLECERSQKWDDKRAESPNFAHSMQRVATDPLSWIFAVIGLLLAMLYPAFSAMSVKVHNHRVNQTKKLVEKKEHEKAVINAEAKRKELTRAYAAGDIDDIQFEHGLDRVYDIIGKPKDKR